MTCSQSHSAYCPALNPVRRYQEALQEGPAKEDHRGILGNLALAFTRAGRHEDAIAAAKQAISAFPAWDKAHYRLGVALTEARRCPEAVDPLKQACLLSKGMPDSATRLLGGLVRETSAAHHHQGARGSQGYGL